MASITRSLNRFFVSEYSRTEFAPPRQEKGKKGSQSLLRQRILPDANFLHMAVNYAKSQSLLRQRILPDWKEAGEHGRGERVSIASSSANTPGRMGGCQIGRASCRERV